MYKFLASTRWIGWLLIVLFFAAICAGLSLWQWDRRAEVAATNEHIEQNWESRPQALDADSPWLKNLPEDDQYTPVKITGRYHAEQAMLVRMRSNNGEVGMEQLVPFTTEQGAVIAIDRGWMPNGDGADQKPNTIPAPPSGKVTVVARLVQGEPNINRDAPAGQLSSVDLKAAGKQSDLPVSTGTYGWLASEEPSAHTPQLLDKPTEDEGMHWSYALQWMAFGLLFFVGFGYAARQQAKLNAADREEAKRRVESGEDEPTFRARRAPQARKRRPRRDGYAHDEDVEDAYLDAAGYQEETPLEDPQRADHHWMAQKN